MSVTDTILHYSELIVAISAAVAAIWKGRTLLQWIKSLWYKMVVPKNIRQEIALNTQQIKESLEVMQGLADRIGEIHKTNQQIIAELKPNGGSSLRDAVNLIIAKQRARDNTTEHYGVFETDKNGQCVNANLAYLRLVGRTLEEVTGNGWINCIHPDDRVTVRDQWAESVQDNRDFEMEYKMMHENGSVFNVIGRAVVMKDNAGRAYGYYGTIQKQ